MHQHLAPQLNSSDLVLMDNLPSHQVAGIAEAIRAADAELIFLSPHSPDLNPIEMVLAKAKNVIRKRTANQVALRRPLR